MSFALPHLRLLLVIALATTMRLSLARDDAIASSAHSVTVWASARFGEDGKVQDVSFSQLTSHPASFLEKLMPLLRRATIPAPTEDGRPAVLETGVRVHIEVDPTSSTFKVKNVALQPLPKRTFAPAPPDVEWDVPTSTSTVTATCIVSRQGYCTDISMSAEGNPPELFRKAVREAFKKWEFEPQRLNGKPVEGKASMSFTLKIE